MDSITKDFGFIAFIVLLVLGVTMALGQKIAYGFLWLLLLSMVVIGWPKIQGRLGV